MVFPFAPRVLGGSHKAELMFNECQPSLLGSKEHRKPLGPHTKPVEKINDFKIMAQERKEGREGESNSQIIQGIYRHCSAHKSPIKICLGDENKLLKLAAIFMCFVLFFFFYLRKVLFLILIRGFDYYPTCY